MNLIKKLLLTYSVVHYSAPLVERANILVELSTKLARPLGKKILFWNFTEDSYQKIFPETSEDLQHSVYNRFSEMSLLDKAQKALSVFAKFKGDSTLFVVENLSSLLTSEISVTRRESLKSFLVEAVFSARQNPQKKYLILLDTNGISLPTVFNDLIPSAFDSLPSSDEIEKLLNTLIPPAEIDKQLLLICQGLTREQIRSGITLALQAAESESSPFVNALLTFKIACFKNLGLNLIPAPKVDEFCRFKKIESFLKLVKLGFSNGAKNLNLPLPKGWVLLGQTGGMDTSAEKFMLAQLTASSLGFSLIGLSIERVLASGEVYLNHLFQRIEACQPVVVYIKGFEQFFSKSDALDPSTQYLFDTFLSWLKKAQSKKIFLIAALISSESLPNNWIDSGIFDTVFSLDLPSPEERVQIIKSRASGYDSRYCKPKGEDPLSDEEWATIMRYTYHFSRQQLFFLVDSAVYSSLLQGLNSLSSKETSSLQLKIEYSHLLEQSHKSHLLPFKNPVSLSSSAGDGKSGEKDNSFFTPVTE